MYPAGMNIIRKSKGMTYPEKPRMTYEKSKKIVGSAKPHYVKSYEIENEDFENTVTFIHYNTKRKDDS